MHAVLPNPPLIHPSPSPRPQREALLDCVGGGCLRFLRKRGDVVARPLTAGRRGASGSYSKTPNFRWKVTPIRRAAGGRGVCYGVSTRAVGRALSRSSAQTTQTLYMDPRARGLAPPLPTAPDLLPDPAQSRNQHLRIVFPSRPCPATRRVGRLSYRSLQCNR